MIDWFDLLAFQRTLKSLLQHHSPKVSTLQHSVFFMVQLSHLYMTTGKTITLIRLTFLSKVMSVLFNTLSRFVIAFLPRSKRLLISYPQSLSTIGRRERGRQNQRCYIEGLQSSVTVDVTNAPVK